MNLEAENIREWDDARWEALVSFAEDFNNFLRAEAFTSISSNRSSPDTQRDEER